MPGQTDVISEGWLKLTVVGCYRSIRTFAAAFQSSESTKPGPRHMVGFEGELRTFLTGNSGQSKLEDVVAELKTGHDVVLKPYKLSRETERRYFLAAS